MTLNPLRLAAVMPALLLLASAALAGRTHGNSPIGEPGKAAQATRTVNIDMTDNMRFTPAEIPVRERETVRFVIRNSGAVKHELVLATLADLREHYAIMMKTPGMEHADPNMVSVAPGQAGEIVWRFTKAGKVDFACLQPGYFDAGMKGFVTISQKAGPTKTEASEGHKH